MVNKSELNANLKCNVLKLCLRALTDKDCEFGMAASCRTEGSLFQNLDT